MEYLISIKVTKIGIIVSHKKEKKQKKDALDVLGMTLKNGENILLTK